LDYGFRVVIAPSFADIFYNNSLKNGIVPIQLDEGQVKKWLKEGEESELFLTVDLEKQIITDGKNNKFKFEIPDYHRQNLINGWDEIALTLQKDDQITAYEKAVQ
jgi:3-isopropylmalate/(R)-2-methylmalate dehydratase small subunit